MRPQPKPRRERDAAIGREVPEWIGATPDTPLPKRVKDRIWLREGGRCYLTGRKIQIGDAFEFEHVIPLCLGGENRESNIKLALKEAHKAKTKADVKARSKTTGSGPNPSARFNHAASRRRERELAVDADVRERLEATFEAAFEKMPQGARVLSIHLPLDAAKALRALLTQPLVGREIVRHIIATAISDEPYLTKDGRGKLDVATDAILSLLSPGAPGSVVDEIVVNEGDGDALHGLDRSAQDTDINATLASQFTDQPQNPLTEQLLSGNHEQAGGGLLVASDLGEDGVFVDHSETIPLSPGAPEGWQEALQSLYHAGMRIGARTSRNPAADDLDIALPRCIAALTSSSSDQQDFRVSRDHAPANGFALDGDQS